MGGGTGGDAVDWDARHGSAGQRDSAGKRLISERTCTQDPGAYVGRDGILRPIGNRPSDAFGRRVANPPQDAISPRNALRASSQRSAFSIQLLNQRREHALDVRGLLTGDAA